MTVTGLPKLILIALLLMAILVLLGFWLKAAFFKEKITGPDLEKIRMPASEKEKAIKLNSFIIKSREDISQFVFGFYNEDQNSFKLTKDSLVSLKATFYSIEALRILRSSQFIPDSQAMLEKIRSYYASPGYYLEEGQDPVFSTRQALIIDRWYEEDLNKAIDLDWLKNNSIENKNLEPEKLDPEYQSAVVDIYKHLETSDKPQILEKISNPYFDYYCDFQSGRDISNAEYLKIKYYQISLISALSGATKADQSCLSQDKLNQIQLNDLTDIKDIYRLYYLQKFYNLKPDLAEFFKRIEKFYAKGGFKEKLADQKPSLIGTYYGVLFAKID